MLRPLLALDWSNAARQIPVQLCQLRAADLPPVALGQYEEGGRHPPSYTNGFRELCRYLLSGLVAFVTRPRSSSKYRS
jgi:hypothetical protein